MKQGIKSELTIGPILFHWPVETWQDFYFRIADEAPVDIVYVGEVVCSKRTPFIEPHYEEVAERLRKAGKKVVFSTLAEVMSKLDRRVVAGMCEVEETMIEANDASSLWHLSGRPHSIGPFVNVYNEDTLALMVKNGAVNVCLPPELPGECYQVMGEKADELDVTLETQVYGRIPLALSARCYHARAHGRIKDTCRFVCEEDPDGMELKTLENESFLTINGIQTLSYNCLNLVHELDDISKSGITKFRLSPHSHDMVATSEIFRAVLDNTMSASEATAKMSETGLQVPFSNGFYHKTQGHKWITPNETMIRSGTAAE